MYYVGFYVIRYRKKAIYTNLKCAFPEKTKEEIDRLAKKFFSHLCDVMVESFKPLTLPTDELLKRFHFTNPEVMEEFTGNQRNYAVVSGHYGNWEWNTILSLYAKRDAIIIYRPLSNKNMDLLFKKIRSRYDGTRLTAMEHVYRAALEYKAARRPFLIYFIADQRPPRNNKFWTTFLHQPTSFFNGTEKLSNKLDLAVVFMHIEKTKRGHYEVTLKKLFNSGTGLPENTVTLAFVDELEKEIKNGLPDDLGEKEKRLKELEADINNLIKEKERVVTMFQKGLIDELSAEKRLKEINVRENTLIQLQQSLYNEINAFKVNRRELSEIRDIANRVINVIDRLEFKDKYELVRSLVEEVIITNETVIIKAKIPSLVQNVDM